MNKEIIKYDKWLKEWEEDMEKTYSKKKPIFRRVKYIEIKSNY